MPKTQPNPLSTSMPSVHYELGKYVTLRTRADGTFRVFFQVPKRLAPQGWPSLIPLPITGPRVGNLSDLAEVDRIRRDAADLYAQLNSKRLGRPIESKLRGRTFRRLIAEWQNTTAWKQASKKTHVHYTTYINHVLAWVGACTPEPDPATLTRNAIEQFLSVYDDAPVTKKHVRKVLRLLLEQSRSLNWRTENPCDGIRIEVPTSLVTIWEQTDVDAYVKAADKLGYKSISLVILLEWEIGQRLTDVRGFRIGKEYDAAAGVFRFWQAKTNSYVTVPISEKLRELLDAASKDQLFLFRNERTAKSYSEERLSKTFAWVRNAAVKHHKGRYLQLRWLRHSCVVQLARAGCEVPEISAITGHSPASASKILAAYLPRDNEVAWNAQKKRGLVSDTQ